MSTGSQIIGGTDSISVLQLTQSPVAPVLCIAVIIVAVLIIKQIRKKK